jgi:hypothetical protein
VYGDHAQERQPAGRVDTHQPVVLTIARIVAGTTTNLLRIARLPGGPA